MLHVHPLQIADGGTGWTSNQQIWLLLAELRSGFVFHMLFAEVLRLTHLILCGDVHR